MSLLMNNIMEAVLAGSGDNTNILAINATISTSAQDNFFTFKNQYPLNATYTPMHFVLYYSYFDSTRMKSIDTVNVADATIKRQSGVQTLNGVVKTCWGLPTLNFYYNGAPITGPIYEAMTNLEVRFTSGWSALSGVKISLLTTASKDSESVDLLNNKTYWVSGVNMSISSAIKGDGKLQCSQSDSILAIYRNPFIPLDTIRIAWPVSNESTSLNPSEYKTTPEKFIISTYVFDLSGKQVAQIKGGIPKSFWKSRFAKGTYIIKLVTASGSYLYRTTLGKNNGQIPIQ